MSDQQKEGLATDYKHTPGPWLVSAATGGWNCVRAQSHDGPKICGPEGMNNESNWHLIAASPDFLALCIEVRETLASFTDLGFSMDFETRLDAALAKAKGEA